MSAFSLVSKYVDGEMSLEQLHAALLDIDLPDPGADRLASRALRIIGEATSADWSEDDLREELERAHLEAMLQHHFEFGASPVLDSGGDFDPAMVTLTRERSPQVA